MRALPRRSAGRTALRQGPRRVGPGRASTPPSRSIARRSRRAASCPPTCSRVTFASGLDSRLDGQEGLRRSPRSAPHHSRFELQRSERSGPKGPTSPRKPRRTRRRSAASSSRSWSPKRSRPAIVQDHGHARQVAHVTIVKQLGLVAKDGTTGKESSLDAKPDESVEFEIGSDVTPAGREHPRSRRRARRSSEPPRVGRGARARLRTRSRRRPPEPWHSAAEPRPLLSPTNRATSAYLASVHRPRAVGQPQAFVVLVLAVAVRHRRRRPRGRGHGSGSSSARVPQRGLGRPRRSTGQ